MDTADTHPGDVVLDEERVDIRRVVVRLHPEGLLERVEILVPDHLGLGHAEDLAFHLAAVHPNQVDVAGRPGLSGQPLTVTTSALFSVLPYLMNSGYCANTMMTC